VPFWNSSNARQRSASIVTAFTSQSVILQLWMKSHQRDSNEDSSESCVKRMDPSCQTHDQSLGVAKRKGSSDIVSAKDLSRRHSRSWQCWPAPCRAALVAAILLAAMPASTAAAELPRGAGSCSGTTVHIIFSNHVVRHPAIAHAAVAVLQVPRHEGCCRVR